MNLRHIKPKKDWKIEESMSYAFTCKIIQYWGENTQNPKLTDQLSYLSGTLKSAATVRWLLIYKMIRQLKIMPY